MSRISWQLSTVENRANIIAAAGVAAADDVYIGAPIPSVKDAASPKEELVMLLKIAAEVEHALMVQYLYAAYSVKSGGGQVQNSLLTIAK